MLPPDSLPDTLSPDAEVRRPVLQGQWPVAALWFPADWYPQGVRHARMLAHWQRGARAYGFAQGDLLCFAEPRMQDCATLPGWPLQRLPQGLCSAQLQENELATLGHADAWLVIAGSLEALYFKDAHSLDPSIWLNLDGLSLLDTFDCSVVIPEPVLVMPETIRSVREVLGETIPPPSPELQAYMRGEAPQVSESAKLFFSMTTKALRLLRYTFWAVLVLGWLAGLGMLLGSAKTEVATQVANGASTSGPPDIASRLSVWLWLLLVPLLVWWLIQMMRTVIHRIRQFIERLAQIPIKEIEDSSAAKADPAQAAQPVSPAPAQQREEQISAGGHGTQAAASTPAATSASGSAKGEGGRGQRAAAASSTQVGRGRRLLPSRRQLQVMPQRWRNWMVRLAKATLMSRLLARQQGDHLSRMMAMFESGQLDEALRHAIPLGGQGESLGQAFGLPQRRQDLRLSTRNGPSSSIHLGDDLQTRLRQMYRRSFEQLDRAGRIDEAVFVLAELLQSRTEALDYLERHQRFAQAAELSLAWEMPGATIVRLHCLAGDWRMAVAVAKRDKAFAAAVSMLEKKWPDPAKRLRLEWGEYLAAQGDWLTAVDVVWSLPDAREQACKWLLCAERAGGRLAAKALVQRAALLPDTLNEYAEEIQALRDDAGRHADRATIAQCMLAQSGPPGAVPRLARLLAPVVLVDQAKGLGALDKKALQRLFSLAKDPLFAVDLPSLPLPVATKPAKWPPASNLTWAAPQAGTQAILDAVPLADSGNYLLALGEAGAVVMDNLGKALFRFAVPAEALVMGSSGQIALALAHRGEVWRVSRLDLAQRAVVELGVLAMEHFAREFDGVLWSVVSKGALRVLDTQHNLTTVIWQVGDLPGEVLKFSTSASLEQLLIRTYRNELEIWRYRLPQRTLGGRDTVADLGEKERLVLTPYYNDVVIGVESDAQGQPSFYYRYAGMNQHFTSPVMPGIPEQIQVFSNYIVFMMETGGEAMEGWMINMGSVKHHSTVSWPSRQTRSRLSGAHWLIFDDAGRLFHLNLENGKQTCLSF